MPAWRRSAQPSLPFAVHRWFAIGRLEGATGG